MDSNQPQRQPSRLGSPEYRARLLTKINCLITVLEVAIAKVTRSLEHEDADERRLNRIRNNLENTLGICSRARKTLLKAHGSEALSTEAVTAEEAKMSYRDYVELASIDEYRRFKELPPIESTQIGETDIDDLARKLSEL